jgi:hypothetical protein
MKCSMSRTCKVCTSLGSGPWADFRSGGVDMDRRGVDNREESMLLATELRPRVNMTSALSAWDHLICDIGY